MAPHRGGKLRVLLCVLAVASPASSSQPAPEGALGLGAAAFPALSLSRLQAQGDNHGFVGTLRPTFRWALECGGCRDVRQRAYRLRVFGPGGEELVDSGVVNSSAPLHRPASPLRSLVGDAVYSWQVSSWATVGGGEELRSTAEGAFRTALLHASEWRAVWLGGGTAFRAEFDLQGGKAIASATAYVSGAGCYELSLNGAKVQPESFMEPSWASTPRLRVYYRAYDVKALLRGAAANAVGIRTGMCKYGYLGAHCSGAAGGGSASCRAVIFQLSVKFTDGSSQTVRSEAESGIWLATTAGDPIRYSHLYHGEIYDARLEDSSWDRPGFQPGPLWLPAIAYPGAAAEFGILTHADIPPIVIAKSRLPASVRAVGSPPSLVFDFGQNMAGFASLKVRGLPAGNGVRMRYAEVLQSDGTVDMAFCHKSGSECKECAHDGGNCANQTDLYISSGAIEEHFTPHFTYHGYRYVQVEGLPADYKLGEEALVGHFLHTNVSVAGRVHFKGEGMEILNKVQSAIVYTQLSNMYHHPTDCPQREKRGWAGDAQITAIEASLNFDTRSFYEHWLQAFVDSQKAGCASPELAAGAARGQAAPSQCCDPDNRWFGCDFHGVADNFSHSRGSVPDVVPYHVPYGGWPGDPSWGAAAVVVPWVLATHYGEPITDELYLLAKGFVDFLCAHGDPALNGIVSFGYYGDWLSLKPTPAPQVTGWTHLWCLRLLAELAQMRGEREDAAKYNATFQRLKDVYNARYLHASSASYGPSQTANLLPLYLDIAPTSLRERVAGALVDALSAAGNRTTSGIIGAAYLLQTLEKIGRADLALQLATETTEPSWGFMVQKGPGTIWETWDDSSNSHSHPALAASIGPYLFSLAGLQPRNWRGGGDSHIVFRLDRDTARRVRSASVSTMGFVGRASFEWALTAEVFALNASVPHGELAEVQLEASLVQASCRRARVGGRLVWAECSTDGTPALTEGVRKVGEGPEGPIILLGSGEYEVELSSAGEIIVS